MTALTFKEKRGVCESLVAKILCVSNAWACGIKSVLMKSRQ